MAIAKNHVLDGEDFHRTREHTLQFLETASKHGADGRDAVIGVIAGIRDFVETQVTAEELPKELEALSSILKSVEE